MFIFIYILQAQSLLCVAIFSDVLLLCIHYTATITAKPASRYLWEFRISQKKANRSGVGVGLCMLGVVRFVVYAYGWVANTAPPPLQSSGSNTHPATLVAAKKKGRFSGLPRRGGAGGMPS